MVNRKPDRNLEYLNKLIDFFDIAEKQTRQKVKSSEQKVKKINADIQVKKRKLEYIYDNKQAIIATKTLLDKKACLENEIKEKQIRISNLKNTESNLSEKLKNLENLKENLEINVKKLCEQARHLEKESKRYRYFPKIRLPLKKVLLGTLFFFFIPVLFFYTDMFKNSKQKQPKIVKIEYKSQSEIVDLDSKLEDHFLKYDARNKIAPKKETFVKNYWDSSEPKHILVNAHADNDTFSELFKKNGIHFKNKYEETVYFNLFKQYNANLLINDDLHLKDIKISNTVRADKVFLPNPTAMLIQKTNKSMIQGNDGAIEINVIENEKAPDVEIEITVKKIHSIEGTKNETR